MTLETIGGIETAYDLRTAIEVMTKEEADFATDVLALKFGQLFPKTSEVSLVPIMKGGADVGRVIARSNSIKSNPMRMSYYTGVGVRLPKPICLKKPDIKKIVDFETGETRAVAFAEGIIDTEGTLAAAIGVINDQIDEVIKKYRQKFGYPIYYTFALISKVIGGPKIPNCYYAYEGHPDIWYIGREFDLNGKGRSLRNVVAIISPYAAQTPKAPYVTFSSLLGEYLKF